MNMSTLVEWACGHDNRWGFPVPVPTRCRGIAVSEAGKLREAVAGFGLDDTAGADEFGKRIAQGLRAQAARAAQIVEGDDGLEIGERGLDALGRR